VDPGSRRALAAAVALALLAASPAAAQRGERADLGESERTLRQTQKQLREERARVLEARRREQSLLAELESIDARLTQKRRQVAALDVRIRRAQTEVGRLQGEIGRLEAQRAGQEEALARRLRALYRVEAQGGALPLLLSGDDPLERAVRLRHLTTLATLDARMIREYRMTSEGLAERKQQREVGRRELGALRGQAEEERAQADSEATKRRVLLAKVKDERSFHERMVSELSEAAQRLEALLRQLQAKQRRVAKAPAPVRPKAAPGAPPPGVGFGTLRGRLGWPVSGRIVGEFGPQVHPRFGTKTFRNGVDIEVAEGTSIVAVYPGHVVYTGWFRGYGNLIIVDHGHDYYTLYGHAAEIRVAEGDEIAQGQVIATVGETGSLQGPRLYFEVRHQGKPQDPADWLRPRG
jgi:septal ring factor EnvC (AmiA/AmiB activator)